MNRIVVADDGSPGAMRGVELAAELAAKTGAELVGFAVVDADQYPDSEVRGLVDSELLGEAEARQWLVEGSAEYLDRCATVAARHGVVRFRTERWPGSDPAATIIAFARDWPADLVVLGSLGHGRLPGMLLGSVSQKLASLSPCSVLIAR
jgi:nucleotide-binding universal stress UspA family protein